MPVTVGFDIYGTLVNPLEMNRHLRPLVGDLVDRFSELWREKQVEYAFRRGLMGCCESCGVCTMQETSSRDWGSPAELVIEEQPLE